MPAGRSGGLGGQDFLPAGSGAGERVWRSSCSRVREHDRVVVAHQAVQLAYVVGPGGREGGVHRITCAGVHSGVRLPPEVSLVVLLGLAQLRVTLLLAFLVELGVSTTEASMIEPSHLELARPFQVRVHGTFSSGMSGTSRPRRLAGRSLFLLSFVVFAGRHLNYTVSFPSSMRAGGTPSWPCLTSLS